MRFYAMTSSCTRDISRVQCAVSIWGAVVGPIPSLLKAMASSAADQPSFTGCQSAWKQRHQGYCSGRYWRHPPLGARADSVRLRLGPVWGAICPAPRPSDHLAHRARFSNWPGHLSPPQRAAPSRGVAGTSPTISPNVPLYKIHRLSPTR